MASVTFPASLGGSGITISDDGDPSTGLAQGGHRVRFVPALQQTVAMAQHARDKAAEAGTHVSTVEQYKDDAQQAAGDARSDATIVANHLSASALNAATASNQSTAAQSAAASASAALLALGNILANGVGAFSVDSNGNLIGSWNEPTVTSISVNASGNLIVTYP